MIYFSFDRLRTARHRPAGFVYSLPSSAYRVAWKPHSGEHVASKPDGVVVTAGEDRRPGGRAQGRGVKVGELETTVGKALHRWGANGGGAVRRRLRKAAVVQDLDVAVDAKINVYALLDGRLESRKVEARKEMLGG